MNYKLSRASSTDAKASENQATKSQSSQDQLYTIYFDEEIKSTFRKQSEVLKDYDHVNQREAKEKSRVAANLGNHAEIG